MFAMLLKSPQLLDQKPQIGLATDPVKQLTETIFTTIQKQIRESLANAAPK
jgi:hypothetical protein